MALINPTTNKPFGELENPFDSSKQASSPEMAKIFQEDFIASQRQRVPNISDTSLSTGVTETTSPTVTDNPLDNDLRDVEPNVDGALSGTTVTSGAADSLIDLYRKDYEQGQKDQNERTKQLEAQRQQMYAQVNNLFGEARERTEEEQRQEKATENVLGFRLGVEGTAYGAGRLRELADEHLYEMNVLDQRKQDALNKVDVAIQAEKYEIASQARQEYKELLAFESQERDRQAQEKAQAINQAIMIRKENREAEQFAQDMLESNLDLYSSALIGYDEEGNLVMPDEQSLEQFAEELNIDTGILLGSLRNKYQELNKLDQEEQKRELDIMNAERQLIPQLFQEFQYAQKNLGFTGDVWEFAKQKLEATTKETVVQPPASYREWELAGGQSGTGKTYAEFIAKETETGLTAKQTQNFLSISNKYQADGVIEAGNKGYTAVQIADEIINNPGDAAKQISLLYTFVKNLDPDSAVREGEIALAQETQSFLSTFKKSIQKLSEGKAISEEAALLLANEVKSLATKWSETAKNRESQFRSQANIVGVGEAFDEYLGGFNQQYKSGSEVYSNVNDFLQNAPEAQVSEFNALRSSLPDVDPNELYQFYLEEQGSSQPLSMGENGSDVTKIASAIGQFESGGNYQARGPVVTSGQYKGERALGKYQIMPGNLPSWSKEALGRVVSEQEFLNNPSIQDQIAQYKMGKIYDQHGTVEDVASVWFSGRPLARAGNAKDVLGTSVPQYVKNIVANYNKLS